MSRRKIDNLEILKELSNSWPKISTINMADSERQKFESRKIAVDLYLSGYPIKEIEKLTGIKQTHIRNFVDKCLEVNDSGEQYGYIGLLYNKRLKPRNGLFVTLMNEHPEVEMMLIAAYNNKKISKWDKSPSFSILHKSMLRMLIQEGLKEVDYPFNSKNKGYNSMISFLKMHSMKNPSVSVNRYGKSAKQLYRSTGSIQPIQASPKRPFARVEVDGHKIDALFTVQIPNELGDFKNVLTERIWIIVAIDVATHVVLGYSISVNSNYDKTDVLECIQNSIAPHKPLKFDEPFKSFYSSDEGFHSSIPRANWAIMDEISFDNASSHLAKDVISNLERKGITINFGPVSMPVRRPIIERFFRTLEENGFHRMPSTVGSQPNDIKRDNAEKDAIAYKITLKEILEITEIVISEYNNRQSDSLGGFSPLELMQQRIDRGFLPSKYIPEDQRENFCLRSITITRKVQGDEKIGRRPYVNFEGYKYSGRPLSTSYLLVGDYVKLEVDPLDIRYIDAFMSSGEPIGKLTINGKHFTKAISMKNNRSMKKSIKLNEIENLNSIDTVSDYADHLTKKAFKSKKAATKLASLKNDAEKGEKDSHVEQIKDSVELEKSKNNEIIANEINLLKAENLKKKWTDPSKNTW
ncbi:hypothetical protein [Acetobacterium wieringae]|nr:hypothetical protein [Acetobacterium wieringae]